DRRGQHMRAKVAEADRIAIRGRACRARDADTAAPAADVFNDDGLAKGDPHALGYDPPDRIDRRACGKRCQHGDRTRWIMLCRRAADRSQPNSENEEHSESSVCPDHRVLQCEPDRGASRLRTLLTCCYRRNSHSRYEPISTPL